MGILSPSQIPIFLARMGRLADSKVVLCDAPTRQKERKDRVATRINRNYHTIKGQTIRFITEKVRIVTMKENIQAYWQHQDASRPLNVLMIGESFCDRTYRISRSGENLLSFEYILEGEGTLVVNGKTCHPGKNDVYILTRNSDHQYWRMQRIPG